MNRAEAVSLSVDKARKGPGRVLAPFSGKHGLVYDPEKPATWGNRTETFYCHGYRKEGEHYHRTFEEMEFCPLLRPEGWQPPVKKLREKSL
jgi:hypothetical protein